MRSAEEVLAELPHFRRLGRQQEFLGLLYRPS